MRIPDESLRKKSEKKFEDVVGFRYCPHCIYCTLHSQTQIYNDGFFYCRYFKKWKHGDDLLEFKCEGYTGKSCASCRKRNYCPNRSDNPFVFCDNYINVIVQNNGYYYVGRRGNIRKNADSTIVELEEKFINGNRANYQRERIEEDREFKQVETTDAGMGDL